MQLATRSLVSLAVLGLVAAQAQSQEKPSVEVGMQAGVTMLRTEGSDATLIRIPGGGPVGSPIVYVTLFPSPNVMVEPRVSFDRLSSEGESVSSIGAAGRVGYLFASAMSGSGYVFGEGSLLRASAGESSETEFGLGGGVGYRVPVRGGIAFRIEGRYSRWFDDVSPVNEITVAVGLGGVAGPG